MSAPYGSTPSPPFYDSEMADTDDDSDSSDDVSGPLPPTSDLQLQRIRANQASSTVWGGRAGVPLAQAQAGGGQSVYSVVGNRDEFWREHNGYPLGQALHGHQSSSMHPAYQTSIPISPSYTQYGDPIYEQFARDPRQSSPVYHAARHPGYGGNAPGVAAFSYRDPYGGAQQFYPSNSGMPAQAHSYAASQGNHYPYYGAGGGESGNWSARAHGGMGGSNYHRQGRFI